MRTAFEIDYTLPLTVVVEESGDRLLLERVKVSGADITGYLSLEARQDIEEMINAK